MSMIIKQLKKKKKPSRRLACHFYIFYFCMIYKLYLFLITRLQEATKTFKFPSYTHITSWPAISQNEKTVNTAAVSSLNILIGSYFKSTIFRQYYFNIIINIFYVVTAQTDRNDRSEL